MSATATAAPRPRKLVRRDWLIGLLLALLGTTLTGLAGRGEGYTRDEGYYFDAAEQYWQWYGELFEHPGAALTRPSIDRWFSNNHEHPVLMKTLFAWSWRIFHKCNCAHQAGRHSVGYAKNHRTLGLLGEAAAMRLPTNLMAGLMVMVVYLFGVAAWSRRAGLVAGALSLAAPRMLFHAALACFDAPMAATWLFCVWCYWRSLDDKSWRWRTGLAFGLALATKLNGFFLPFVLGLHYVCNAAMQPRGERWRWFMSRRLTVFGWMALLGPIVQIGHWPWMWFDTVARFREYLAFHLHHVYYNMEFLGLNYNKPPFPMSYAWVMTLLTMPVTTLALAIGGGLALAWPALRRREFAPTSPGLLVGMNALFPICIISFTGAPIFGGVKHWLPSVPFLALLAGAAIDRLCTATITTLQRSRPNLDGKWPALVLCSMAVLPALAATWESQPYALTSYNLLAGGPPGGADLGMNRQYWGYSTRGVLPYIDEHARPHAQVYWHDTNQAQLNMDVRERLARDDLGNTGLEEPGVRASDIAMVIHEKHFAKYEYWIWDFYGTTRPSFVLADEGVPIVTLYERPEAKR